jgi:phosphatidylethanolamine N-methyltransferase
MCGASSIVYLIIPFLGLPKWVSLAIFCFWRLCYNAGIGYMLHIQSNNHTLVRWYREKLNPDPKTRPTVYKWTKKLLSAPRGPEYNFDEAPAALNTWFCFRFISDFILGHDLGSYVLVLITYWEWPDHITIYTVLTYLIGIFFCVFAAWAKADAYRVIKDYAWYWGDFFFTVKQSLKFDRVFALSPHPMYTIGYAFMYGMALLSRSYTVLYAGLFGHACQLVFLTVVENPHIDKIYGEIQSLKTADEVARERGYLHGDLIAFKNFNIYRGSDIMFVIIVVQTILCYFWGLTVGQWCFVIIVWRLLHTVGLGWILNAQSKDDAMVKRFESLGWTREDAFDSWKKLYNCSATMQWVTFITAALSMYPMECWHSLNVCGTLHFFAFILIALNLWSINSQFQTIGEFGWFYGDFFIHDDAVPLKLSYQGVYRFLNNPDAITGFAGFYGFALLSESFPLFMMALFGQVSAYAFVMFVERPHMRKKYGETVRGTSGSAAALKQILAAESERFNEIPILKHLVSSPTLKESPLRKGKKETKKSK